MNERKNLLGKYVCLYMVKGLFSKWKFVLNYNITANPINANIIYKTLNDNINALHKIDIIPRVVVCDQGSNNQAAFTLFAITNENPYATIST